LVALLHGTLVVRVSQTAAFNRGRHLYSAGRPSGWALAHISSLSNKQQAETTKKTCCSFVKLSAENLLETWSGKSTKNLIGWNCRHPRTNQGNDLQVLVLSSSNNWLLRDDMLPCFCQLTPSAPVDNTWTVMSIWRIRGKISELYCAVVCMIVVHSDTHSHVSSSQIWL